MFVDAGGVTRAGALWTSDGRSGAEPVAREPAPSPALLHPRQNA